jgi:flagellar hook-length control protein FliK
LARLLAIAAGVPHSQAETTAAARSGGTSSNAAEAATTARGDAVTTSTNAAAANTPATNTTASSRGATFASTLDAARTMSPEAARSMDRVIEVVRANVGLRNSSMTMRLEPPELGQMRIDARLRNDVLSLRIEASSDAAREMLQSRFDDLRQALERHGISVDRFEIDIRPPSTNNNTTSNSHDRQQGQPSTPSQTADGGLPEQWQQRSDTSGQSGQDDAFDPRAMDGPDEAEAHTGAPGVAASESFWTTESSVNVLA